MFYLLVLTFLTFPSFEARFFSKLLSKLSAKRKERIRSRHKISYIKKEIKELDDLPTEDSVDQTEIDQSVSEIEIDSPSDDASLIANSENQYLIELSRSEFVAGNLEIAIDCLIAAILNTEDEQDRAKRQKECISLCRSPNPKTGLEIKTKLILADALEGKEISNPNEMFQKARKYTASREYTRARDLLFSLYLSGEGNRFECIYRCGMISMEQRKFYLARGFFLIASELIEEKNAEWPKVAIKIARCEDMINRNANKADFIVKKIIELHPEYKPRDEKEKKLFDRVNKAE